jgi:hypothetical protein
MNAVERARERTPEWTPERSARVFSSIQKTQRQRRTLSIALSSMVGVAILVLAVRALGSSMAASPSYNPPATTYVLDDGGSRG